MIRIAIVDDHAFVRAGLLMYLSEHDDLEVVAEATNGHGALRIAQGTEVDVLIMDISMLGYSGIDALAEIRSLVPDLPVLILSSFPEMHYAATLLRQGASGYLNKECDPAEIVKAVRTLARGRNYITTRVAEVIAEQLERQGELHAHEALSERELQVFLRLAKGQTVGRIASHLGLSVKTVSTYRTRLLAKLNLASNSGLTYYALKNGLIQ